MAFLPEYEWVLGVMIYIVGAIMLNLGNNIVVRLDPTRRHTPTAPAVSPHDSRHKRMSVMAPPL